MIDRLPMVVLALLMGALLIAALMSGRAFAGVFSYDRDEQPISFWLVVALLAAAFCSFVYSAITG